VEKVLRTILSFYKTLLAVSTLTVEEKCKIISVTKINTKFDLKNGRRV
jgi:hypothetical protein